MSHMQIMCGNIKAFLRENVDSIGHFHVAEFGQHEPYTGEFYYPYILREIDLLKYTGYGWPGVLANSQPGNPSNDLSHSSMFNEDSRAVAESNRKRHGLDD